MDEFLIIDFASTQFFAIYVSGDNFACDQAVWTEAIYRFEVLALEVHIRFLDELSLDLLRCKSREAVDNGLITDRPSGRCGQARVQDLGWLRVADREFSSALDVNTGGVRRRADKAEIVLPAHRRNHVLGREVESAIQVSRTYEDQRGNGEKTIPDWRVGVDLNEMTVV